MTTVQVSQPFTHPGGGGGGGLHNNYFEFLHSFLRDLTELMVLVHTHSTPVVSTFIPRSFDSGQLQFITVP